MSSWKQTVSTREVICIILFTNLLLPPWLIRGVKQKDTGDIIEEILILKTALLADLFNGLQKQHFTLWPVVLQEHHHMAEGQVVTVVCEGAELNGQN